MPSLKVRGISKGISTSFQGFLSLVRSTMTFQKRKKSLQRNLTFHQIRCLITEKFLHFQKSDVVFFVEMKIQALIFQLSKIPSCWLTKRSSRCKVKILHKISNHWHGAGHLFWLIWERARKSWAEKKNLEASSWISYWALRPSAQQSAGSAQDFRVRALRSESFKTKQNSKIFFKGR